MGADWPLSQGTTGVCSLRSNVTVCVWVRTPGPLLRGGGVLVQGSPQRLAGPGTVLLVDPVDHLVVAHVDGDGFRVRVCSYGPLRVDLSCSIPHINGE